MTDDLVDRVADEMLRVRVRGGGVEHEATAAIRIALEEAAKIVSTSRRKKAAVAAIRAMIGGK